MTKAESNENKKYRKKYSTHPEDRKNRRSKTTWVPLVQSIARRVEINNTLVKLRDSTKL